jgi:hypothetical protein
MRGSIAPSLLSAVSSASPLPAVSEAERFQGQTLSVRGRKATSVRDSYRVPPSRDFLSGQALSVLCIRALW